MEQFLSALRGVLQSSSQKMMSAKVSALKHLPAVVRGMTSFMAPAQLCREITDFFALAEGLERNGKMNENKLLLYRSVADSALVRARATRAALLPALVAHTWAHLLYDLGVVAGRKERLRAEDRATAAREALRCIAVFGALSDAVATTADAAPRERSTAVLLLLRALPLVAQCYTLVACGPEPALARPADLRGAAVVALSIARLAPSDVWEAFLQSTFPHEAARDAFLASLLELVRAALLTPFPPNWGEVVGFLHSAILHLVHLLACSKDFTSRLSAYAQATGPLLGGAGKDKDKDRDKDNNDSNDKESGDDEDAERNEANVNALGEFRTAQAMVEELLCLCTEFVLSPSLRRETLSVTVLEQYGDLRLPMCALLRRLWRLVGAKQSASVTVVENLVAMAAPSAALPPALQSTAIALLAAMCTSDAQRPAPARSALAALLSVCDAVTDAQKGDDCLAVAAGLHEACASSSSASPEGVRVAEALAEFVRLKQALAGVCRRYAARQANDDASHANSERKCAALDEVMCALHDVRDFLGGVPRTAALRTRYTELIIDAMKERRKYELGLALLQLSACYAWDDTSLVPRPFVLPPVSPPQESSMPGTPVRQPAWEVKADTNVAAAHALQFGQLYEEALAALADTAAFAAARRYDYRRAAEVLRLQAGVAQSVAKGGVLPREYYRVGFYGADLPPRIRNRDFIYVARPLEKLAEFQERMRIAYPDSEILMKTDALGPEVTDVPGMKLLITKVLASSESAARGSSGGDENKASDAATTTSKNGASANTDADATPSTGCRVFMYSKPMRLKKREEGENEFKGLYLHKQFFFTADALPNSRVRTAVVARCEAVTTPIENACDMVRDKNAELRALIRKYDDAPPGAAPNVQPLAMALNGCVMAAVNGGLTMYEEAFLTEQFRREEPAQAAHQGTLLASIEEQLAIVDHGLQTFEHHCPPDMTDLMMLLKDSFAKMRSAWDAQSAKAASVISPNDGSQSSSV